jgi:hypothetical protein
VAVVETDNDRSVGDRSDGTAFAVDQTESPVVLERHDSVPDRERSSVDVDAGWFDVTVRDEPAAGHLVEFSDIGPCRSEHDRVVTLQRRWEPVANDAAVDDVAVLPALDVTDRIEELDRAPDVTVTELGQGFAFDRVAT